MDGFRSVLLKRMSEDELRTRIAGVREEFAGLIDEEAAVYIIAGDRGDLKGALMPVSDLAEGMWASVAGTVVDTGCSSGGKDVAWVVVEDGTGRVRCVLWRREHIEMVRSERLTSGNRVRLINGRVRAGRELELHIDSKGTIEVLGNEFVDIANISVGDVASLKGVVTEFAPSREFTRRDGSVGRVASFVIFDGTGDVRTVLWDEAVDLAANLQVGDEVTIRSAVVKERDGRIEVHSRRGTGFTVKLA